MATSTRPLPRPRAQPVQRDEQIDSQTRNKENVRSPSPNKPVLKTKGRSFIPSLVQPSDKSDFFTDSYLADDHASETSLIPSPLPQSTALSRPRRRVHPTTSARDQDLRPKYSPTRADPSLPAQPYSPSSQKQQSTRRTSPIRSTGLSTPPRSRDGSLTESPVGTQFSSPPRALTETYERIDQEEDLAATEGEISDPESEPAQDNYGQFLNGYRPTNQVSNDLPQSRPRSPGLTPTNTRFANLGHPSRNEDLTTASVLSDPTGMSFVNQLSDPNLAHAMTPHVLQSAADKEALRKIWDSKRPIAFGKANKFHLDADQLLQSLESPPQPQPQRLIAFSKAGKRKLASDLARLPLHQRTFSDVTDRIEHSEAGHAVHNDNWHNDEIRREAMPLNPRIHRVPYFPRTHGFPERQLNTEMESPPQLGRQAESESPHAQPIETNQYQGGDQDRPRRSTTSNPIHGLNLNQSEPDLTLDSRLSTQTSPDVDWMQAAATKPTSTTAAGIPRRSRGRLSDAYDPETSPEKSRRLDLDFTGQSFQVSDSPPVRNKSLAQDLSREREIRGLAKRAVTTSRLTQLRERESLEKLTQSSKSHVSEIEDVQKGIDQNDTGRELNGVRGTEPSAALSRSNSIGSGKRISSAPPVRPSTDRSQSHDLLQRLARSSSTPRSTTPSERPSDGASGDGAKRDVENSPAVASNPPTEDDDTIQGPRKPISDAVKATPKVTGAWTDTILPDTIKTVKQTGQRLVYSQTPHVSAGGWIDTPAPPAQSSRLEPLLESTQEVPEELMNGIVKDSASGSDAIVIALEPNKASLGMPPPMAQSLAKKVLAEAKEKLKEQSPRRPASNADDSLVLGNATIQSLENVLDMDETDMTILSRIGEETLDGTETQVLDRLSSKLEGLLTHIHDARKGLSNLESRISQPEEQSSTSAAPATLQVCEVCGQPQHADNLHTHPRTSQTNFPFTLLNLTLPIPVLFRMPPKTSTSQWRLPRPTPLGWLILALWTWYLLECTLAEIYSHPVYASHYVWPSEHEPEFPFVLPTMLWRWSRLRWVYPYLVQPVVRMVVGVLRMIGMWLGLTDGFADGPGDVVVEQLVETIVYQRAEGLNMMNDEVL